MTDYPEQSEQSRTPTRQIGDRFVGGMAAPASGRSGSAMGSSFQSPSVDRTRELLPPSDDRQLEARRKWLYNELSGRGEPKEFDELLEDLDLSSDFNRFVMAHPGLFQSLAETAPTFVDGVMARPRKIGTRVPLPSSGLSDKDIVGKGKELAVTTYFQRLVDTMCEEAATRTTEYARSGHTDKSLPTLKFNLVDHQNSALADSKGLKMDLVLFTPVASDSVANIHIIVEAKRNKVPDPITVKDFAQIADYQYLVWKAQPTRTFVPVLVPHGPKLDLVVFTRDHWYRMEIGYLCHWLKVVNDDNIEKVRSTMVQLYFLITRPSESFGHFCDISYGWKHVSFVRDPGVNSMLTAAMTSSNKTTDSVALAGYIDRFVHPRGRLAHVFQTKYKGVDVFLKLSWTPVDRLPEGAIYDVLEKAGVQGVPKVFDSGLLKNNFFGYRLEYLVLEDCGSSIMDYLLSKHAKDRRSNAFSESVKSIVQQTLSCLVQARVKGNILHRDISPGNIRIARDGTVKVIDWGYAKVLDDKSLDSDDDDTVASRRKRRTDAALKWGCNDAVVTPNGTAHRPLTGTPSYMSIPVLSGATVRGLPDDIESIFYVILDVLAQLQTKRDDAACGFKANDNRTLAMVRAGCLSSKLKFPRFFGISSCSDPLLKLLRDLREFLFINSDGYIASDLIDDPETKRGTRVDLLEPYIDRETVGLLSVKGGEMLTPKESGRQMSSIRPPILLTGGPSSPTQNLGSVGISMDGLNLSRNSLLRRGRSIEQIEEVDEDDPFGPESKRPRLQGD
ncbi:hypothetical protein GGI13_002861 [Coemansia sp. RSA 455]|nr:hypothetical protein GGI13_002861 [Coemansia sp. RSA 455]